MRWTKQIEGIELTCGVRRFGDLRFGECCEGCGAIGIGTSAWMTKGARGN
jgi:hypothetical protein